MKTLFALLAKDVRLEARTKATVSSVFALALLIVLILGFALPRGADPQGEGGLLWVALLFPGILVQGRVWAHETEGDTLDGLLSAPVPPSLLWLSKFLFSLGLTLALALLLTPVFLVLLGAEVRGPVWLFLLTLLLGVVGLAAVGCSLSALTARTRFREVLLPLLLLPLLIPLFLADVVLTGAAFSGQLGGSGLWLLLMAVFDLVYLTVPLLLADIFLEV